MKILPKNALVFLTALSFGYSSPDSNLNDRLLVDFGTNLGWGSPYGIGIEAACFIIPSVDIGSGFGFSMSGIRVGGGIQYFFVPERHLSPLLGIDYSHNGGVGILNVNVNQDQAVYKISSGNTLHCRTGFRYAFPTVNLYAHIGYRISLSGGRAGYVSGSTSDDVKSLAELMEPKGLELSLGVKFRIRK